MNKKEYIDGYISNSQLKIKELGEITTVKKYIEKYISRG